jgi:hypothetical protein
LGTLTSINNFAAVTASKAGKIESLDEEWHDGHKRHRDLSVVVASERLYGLRHRVLGVCER